MALSTSHQAAVSSLTYTTFESVQIVFKEGVTANLLSTSGSVQFMVGTTLTKFTHRHPTVGQLATTGEVQLDFDPNSPVWKFSIDAPSADAIGYLANPRNQGSVVQYWSGVVDPSTGSVIGVQRLWKGHIDTCVCTIGEDVNRVDFDVITPAEFLMQQDEAERLNLAWQLHHYGQKGLAFNVEGLSDPYWGNDVVKVSTGSGGGGGFGGGSGSGGGNFLQDLFLTK